MRRIVIAGASSRSGKTTITCGILSALRQRGISVSAFKTGPDYIDTEYLRRSGKCEAYNLDTWLMNESGALSLFARASRADGISIVEGAMGLFDGGINGTSGIAKLINAPVVLVINARSMGESAAAIALGFREFDSGLNIAGVILNFTGSDYHEEIIAEALESKGIKFLGALRRDEALEIPERHLGLLQANENEHFDFDRLGAKISERINIDEIIRISDSAGELRPSGNFTPSVRKYDVRVAVARDEAFTFIYPESVMALEDFGAEVIYFSPLNDERLPDADGYIFSGGYPEIFADSLAANASMLDDVRRVSAEGRPVLAECGGMMYLCRTLRDINGRTFAMPGVIPFDSYMASRSVMGYMTGRALRDNLLCRKGESVGGHEYHYGRIEPEYQEGSEAFALSRRNRSESKLSGYSCGNVLASWLHVNLWGNPEITEHFLNVLTSSRL